MLSEQFGYEVLPKYGEMYWAGVANIRMFNNRKNALEFFKLDVELYPNSIDALETLADFYIEDNELENAIPLLERALTLVSEQDEEYSGLFEKLNKYKSEHKAPAP